MTDNFLAKLFEHNTWANLQLLQACSALTDEQLDAEPQTATRGSIRRTLEHLVDSEQDYLFQLTGKKPPFDWQAPPPFAELEQAARISGEGFINFARDESDETVKNQIIAPDGYVFETWVLILQAINHATEHREQIKSMLTSLGVTPPRVDGWEYGRVENALIPPSTRP